jgi:hypothetical protein
MRPFVLLLLIMAAAGRLKAQVNLQTGSAEFNLPLFNYSDIKSGLSTSVNLSYTSSNGLKIDDRASNVGTGWMLQAGGYIERKLNGQPDDQYCPQAQPVGNDELIIKRELSDWNDFDRYYPNGLLYTGFAVQERPKQLAIMPRFKANETKDYQQTPRGMADREQDVFLANLNGRMVQFVIGKKSTGTGIDPAKIVCLDDSKLTFQVTTSYLPPRRTMITQFEVTDESGIKYTFGDMEYTYLTESNKTFEATPYDVNQMGFSIYDNSKKSEYVVNRWCLSKITNTLTGESIVFQYNTIDVSCVAKFSVNYSETKKLSSTNTESEGLIFQYIKSYVKSKRLSKIITTGGYSVAFTYDAGFIRYDVEGDHPLRQVQIAYNNAPVKTYILSHGNFFKKQVINNPGTSLTNTEQRYLRLCLTQVAIASGSPNPIPPHKFEYFTGSEAADSNYCVPQRYSLNQDFWGYHKMVISDFNNEPPVAVYNMYKVYPYKTELMNAISAAPRQTPDNGFAIPGLLKKIILPEGGSINYTYSQRKDAAGSYTGGVSVSRTLVSSEEGQPHQELEYHYVLSNGQSSLWGVENPLLTAGSLNGNPASYLSYQKTLSHLYAGNQQVATPYNFAFYSRMVSQFGMSIMQSVMQAAMAPLSAVNVVMYAYQVYQTIKTLVMLYTTLSDGFTEYRIYDYPLDFNAQTNPLPVYYTRTEVVDPNSAIGKTVYEYSTLNSNDFLITTGYTFPYSARQRLESWRCGLPVKVSHFDNNGNLVKETINEYEFTSNVLGSEHASRKLSVNHFMSNRYDEPVDNNNWTDENYVAYDDYSPRAGHAYQIASTEKNYEAGVLVSEVSVQNTYDIANNTLRKTRSFNSKGERVGKTYYYPYDYQTGLNDGLDILISNHVVMPVAEVSWVEKGGIKMVTGYTASVFTVLPGNKVKLLQQYRSNLAEPVVESLPDNNDPGNLLNYPSLNLKTESTTIYNAFADPVQQEDDKGRKKAVIYGYDHRNIVADVIGAGFNEIAYTSFEPPLGVDVLEYPNPNNLDLGNSSRLSYSFGKVSDDHAVTGNYAYQAIGGFKFELDVQRFSLFTFWATSADFTVNGVAGPARTGPTINGWTYYEYDVYPGNAQRLEITSGNAGVWIDEVRLYPANSKMITSTYYPPSGKTSVCDANNRISYYEYDEYNRLWKIRDEKRNIIKTYEYHYKGN